MVSIAGKIPTARSATATSLLLFSHPETYSILLAARLRKGDAFSVARIAGIQAAKKTSDLIPLAHPGLDMTGASVRLEPFVGNMLPYPLTRKALGLDENERRLSGGVLITATVSCEGKTGVEMEAITAASIAGLTMYDMLKAVDKSMVLTETRVIAKSGGKSGDWTWNHQSNKIVKVDEVDKEKEKEKDLERLAQVLKDKEIRERLTTQRAAADDSVQVPPAPTPTSSSTAAATAVVPRYVNTVASVTPGRVSADDFGAARRARFARSMAARRSQRMENPTPVVGKSPAEADKADT
ncbi:hypothetical protein A1O3_01206 [Capronia epimyces CBS 606.96]|uniref:Molybdopterin cofactor biosynthesis C (MoaC) domain-containing protein n=1 Tax=Capronia epimyces CBS 606.96 TaxID=1182542 RepID=W9ZDQ6_9EURO|nr:uncharacterized protein A1O3_01206 [Capronia epimyces CBS 606.96]EXJ92654.1 hypothetical protein A1O3_01206 [Capronia epimyces CBS 606.96]